MRTSQEGEWVTSALETPPDTPCVDSHQLTSQTSTPRPEQRLPVVSAPLADPRPAARVWAQDGCERPLAVLGLVMPPQPVGWGGPCHLRGPGTRLTDAPALGPHCRADGARHCSVLQGLTRAQWGSRNLTFAGFSL